MRLSGRTVLALWEPTISRGWTECCRTRCCCSPIAQAWAYEARERGRPSISMATFVRLTIVKQRTGWGYETLVREVSDSLHLRRLCLIAIDQRVPERIPWARNR